MSPSDRLEIRENIKFCHDQAKMPNPDAEMIEITKREHLVSRALVFKWHRRFANGKDILEEQECCAGKEETVWRYDSDVNP